MLRDFWGAGNKGRMSKSRVITLAVFFPWSSSALNVLIFDLLPSSSCRLSFYFRSAVIPVLLELIRCHLLSILSNAEKFFQSLFSNPSLKTVAISREHVLFFFPLKIIFPLSSF